MSEIPQKYIKVVDSMERHTYASMLECRQLGLRNQGPKGRESSSLSIRTKRLKFVCINKSVVQTHNHLEIGVMS